MIMKKALACEGLAPVKNLEELIQLAASNGFDTVDAAPPLVREAVSRIGLEQLCALVQESGISIGSFPSSCDWNRSDEIFESGLQILEQDLKLYAALGCRVCHNFLMPSCDVSPDEWMNVMAQRVYRTAALTGQYGVRLALEYVGPHHMRSRFAHPFVWNIAGTLELIRRSGADNAGLLLDSLHWYTAQETIQDILSLPREMIVHVHINDAPDLPVEDVRDNGRLYPGEGVIDLHGFIQALDDVEYDGIVALEVLKPQPVTGDNQIIAHQAYLQMEPFFTKGRAE